MYKVEFLPSAKQDLTEIALYIKNELNNPTAALSTVERIIEAAEKTADFPYANPVYIPIRTLKKEYRKIPVKNYIIFYSVNENQKLVTVSRIVYAKRNLSAQRIDYEK